MMVIKLADVCGYDTPEGKMTPLFVRKNLSVFRLELPKNIQIEPHSHPNENILMLISGLITFTDTTENHLKPGDIAIIPADYTAQITVHEDSVVTVLSAPSHFGSINDVHELFGKMFTQHT
nr:hypothetical protein [uncultured Methanospirillum sp.]